MTHQLVHASQLVFHRIPESLSTSDFVFKLPQFSHYKMASREAFRWATLPIIPHDVFGSQISEFS